MVPYFFISHAVSGSGRQYVEQFHADLQSELYGWLGHESRFEGTLADHRKEGARAGPPRSTPAMSCRSLVVLYSEEFFRSARCAYDLSVFKERMGWRLHRTGDASVTPVGVVWNASGLPERLAEEAGQQAGAVGSDYARRGVGRFIRDSAARGGYVKVLRSVAERVVGAAGHPPPVMTSHDVDYLTQFTAISSTPVFSWDMNVAPVPVAWHTKRAGSGQDPAPLVRQESLPRTRSWFSSPEEGERPILRGPHS